MSTIRAWSVNDFDRERGVVVFAETRGKARAIGCGEVDSEFMEVEVRRASEFDCFGSAEKIRRLDYLKLGWWQGCKHCGGYVHADDDNDPHYSPADDDPVCGRCAQSRGTDGLTLLRDAIAAEGSAR